MPIIGDHEAAVARKVESLQGNDLRVLETAVIEKRLQWCRDNLEPLDGTSPTPRLGYETLLLRYLGLSPDDVPVVYESDTKITWLSRNPCATLDACLRLNLATPAVCKAVYERPTQALLSCLDPELRFVRDYSEMRPVHPHCKETILRLDFEHTMSMALAEARKSILTGNKGYGALVMFGDRLLSIAHDTAATERDPSLHAEMNAIRGAVQLVGDSDLCGAVLFSTCEPCPMCSALAVWANVTTIVFGASIKETARLGKARIQVSAADIVEHSPGWMEVIGGVMVDECLELYR